MTNSSCQFCSAVIIMKLSYPKGVGNQSSHCSLPNGSDNHLISNLRATVELNGGDKGIMGRWGMITQIIPYILSEQCSSGKNPRASPPYITSPKALNYLLPLFLFMFSFLKKCHKSQADRVLELLQAHKGEAVALPRILDLRPRIAHHTECIRELRQRGYDIECKSWFTDIKGDKVHCSQYTLKGFSLFPHEKHTKKQYTKEEYEEGVKKGFNAGLNLEAPNAEAYLETL